MTPCFKERRQGEESIHGRERYPRAGRKRPLFGIAGCAERPASIAALDGDRVDRARFLKRRWASRRQPRGPADPTGGPMQPRQEGFPLNITMKWLAAIGLMAIAACGGTDANPFGGVQPGTGGAGGAPTALGTGGTIVAPTGGAPGTGSGGHAATATGGSAAGAVGTGGSVAAGGASAGGASTGGFGGSAVAHGGSSGAAGAGGSAPTKKTCTLDSDCGDPWTMSCTAHPQNQPSTCEVTCDPPCLAGTVCAGGNTCKNAGGQYDTADARACVISCDSATSVCLNSGTTMWTCTPLCTGGSFPNGSCPAGYHCVNSAQVPGWPGTGECGANAQPGEPCNPDGSCATGTCNQDTKICPTVGGADCATGADCISGVCGPTPRGGMACSG